MSDERRSTRELAARYGVLGVGVGSGRGVALALESPRAT
jgi:hypothetical protein